MAKRCPSIQAIMKRLGRKTGGLILSFYRDDRVNSDQELMALEHTALWRIRSGGNF